MFALGLLSILHLLVLPGVLVVRGLGLHRGGWFRTVLLAGPISLVLNHLLVFALTGAGVYTRGVLTVVVAAELAAVWVLWRRDREVAGGLGADVGRWRGLVSAIGARRPWAAVAGFAAVAGALWMMALWAMRVWEVLGTVFLDWDAVVSWNRWAIDWANNRLPTLTWHYPQLLPTAYASTYVLMGGTEVQFFAKAVAAVFPLLMLGAAGDLCLRGRRAAYAAGVWAIGWLLWKVLGAGALNGFADAPVAAMTFLGVYVLLAGGENESWAEVRARVMAGAVIAAGAALTKQAGWLIAGVYPVLAYVLVLRPRAPAGLRARAAALATVGLVLAVAGPWYVYRRLIPSGQEFDYLLTIIHGERTLLERAERGVLTLIEHCGLPRWVVLGAVPAGLAASLLDRQWRWITLLVTAPLIAVWLLYFTYDQRNLAAALPTAAVGIAVGCACAGAALAGWARRVGGGWDAGRAFGRVGRARAVCVGVCVAGALWLSAGKFRDSMLLRRQVRQQMSAGHAIANALLVEYGRSPGFGGKVLSNYQVMPFLPEPELAAAYVFDPMSSAAHTRRLLAKGGFGCIFYTGHGPVPEYLAEWVRAGALEEAAGRRGPHGPDCVLLRIVGALP